MGMAGLMFEPHPPNFEIIYMMLKQFFDIYTGFRFSNMQCGSVPSIPVDVLDLSYPLYYIGLKVLFLPISNFFINKMFVV